jgi:hypothetical protein
LRLSLPPQSVGLLKTLNKDDYHVTVIAPQNYSLFTPLLPSATVGTVEPRSLVEPLRRTLARVKGHFIQAKAVDLEMADKLVEIETADGDRVYVPCESSRFRFVCPYLNSSLGRAVRGHMGAYKGTDKIHVTL